MGYIDAGGKYHKTGKLAATGTSSQWKAGDHDRQRMEHQWELVQPFVGGDPNPEFIEAYPEESKIYGFVKGPEEEQGV